MCTAVNLHPAPLLAWSALDEDEVDRLERALAAAGTRRGRLDLSGVRTTTTAGVIRLVQLQRRWHEAGRALVVERLSPAVYHALERTGLDAVLLVRDYGVAATPPAQCDGLGAFVLERDGRALPYLVLQDDAPGTQWLLRGLRRLDSGAQRLPVLGDVEAIHDPDTDLLTVWHRDEPLAVRHLDLEDAWADAAGRRGRVALLVGESVEPDAPSLRASLRRALTSGACLGASIAIRGLPRRRTREPALSGVAHATHQPAQPGGPRRGGGRS